MRGEDPLAQVERVIGHRFANRDYLRDALVHVSVAGDDPSGCAVSNERLEFLGDAVLELVVSEALYKDHEGWREGLLTQARARFVTTKTLAEAAMNLGLGDHLVLGKGEESTGGRRRESNLADVFEAICGALYLDGGLEVAVRFIHTHLLEGRRAEEAFSARDPKTRLQEELQSDGAAPPTYRLVTTSGPDHRPTFVSEVLSDGEVLGSGSGGSKKDAERAAAAEALERLGRPNLEG